MGKSFLSGYYSHGYRLDGQCCRSYPLQSPCAKQRSISRQCAGAYSVVREFLGHAGPGNRSCVYKIGGADWANNENKLILHYLGYLESQVKETIVK